MKVDRDIQSSTSVQGSSALRRTERVTGNNGDSSSDPFSSILALAGSRDAAAVLQNAAVPAVPDPLLMEAESSVDILEFLLQNSSSAEAGSVSAIGSRLLRNDLEMFRNIVSRKNQNQ